MAELQLDDSGNVRRKEALAGQVWSAFWSACLITCVGQLEQLEMQVIDAQTQVSELCLVCTADSGLLQLRKREMQISREVYHCQKCNSSNVEVPFG